jgi:hypothetical protein
MSSAHALPAAVAPNNKAAAQLIPALNADPLLVNRAPRARLSPTAGAPARGGHHTGATAAGQWLLRHRPLSIDNANLRSVDGHNPACQPT